MKKQESEKLFEAAKNYFPGGVNSPVRAFRSVGGTPLFIDRGEGCYIYDADENKYIDFCGSWGPLILGHAHPAVMKKINETVSKGSSFGAPTRLENELAKLILDNNPFLEKLRFVSSGTEAVMSAIRLARGYTGKNLIIKFDGCYHGHADAMLVKAGSGLATFGISSSSGVPESVAGETIVLPLNDRQALSDTINKYGDDLAAVIIEPVPANNGLLIQDKEYLEFLRDITSKHNILLIFDEVISGFRIGFTGAAGYYGIQPDILTYGKIIGGGLPVGAYGASAKIMNNISPDGSVYQGGTLSGNPVAMAAGIATLTECLKENFYAALEKKTISFADALNSFAAEHGFPFKVFSIGSIFWFSFSEKEKIQRADQLDPSMQQFNLLFHSLLEKGVYLGPSGYEVGFISAAHADEVIEEAVRKICDALVVASARENSPSSK